MTQKNFCKAAVLAVSLLGATAASAVPITFDFANSASANNASFASNMAFSSGGVDLNVSAYAQSWLGWNQTQVSRWSGGLGVRGGESSTQVDGTYRNEALIFDFSQDVELTSISFMFFDRNDEAVIKDYDARWFWDQYVTEIEKREVVTDSNGVSTFVFSENVLSSLLGVLALDYNDNFTVYSMTVDSARASVPEPSIIALLGIGLIGLGLARRRSSIAA